MPLFEYIATNKQAEEIRGLVEAGNSDVALYTLTDQGLRVVSLKEKREKRLIKFEIPFFNRVKIKDIVVFSRQLAVMVSATLPVVQALRILVGQTENTHLKNVISEVAGAVDGGSRLSDAFAMFPQVFSGFYVSMVRSGETAGKLEEVLVYLADQQEKDYDLLSKTKGAMIYPAFILFGLVVVGIVMMVFVVPKLTEILEESGAKLPFTTRLLIGVSSFMSSYWWLLILLLIILGVGFYYWRKTESGKKQIDYIILKLPVFGPAIFQKIFLVRFTRSLATLLLGGVNLTEALKITKDVVSNEVYKDILSKTIDQVEDGNPMASVFLDTPIVPSMVGNMLSVGEQTGRIDLVLNKLSDFYAREVDNAVANLVTLIEPLILMLMGLAVGVMVAAILLPMYNLASGTG